MIKEIFVFGSNLAGRHGKGSALEAKQKHGAIYGIGVGLQGNSYAIPTKDKNLKSLPLSEIEKYVKDFLVFAKENPEITFNVVKIGCGLAGYKEDDILPLFKNITDNVKLPADWQHKV